MPRSAARQAFTLTELLILLAMGASLLLLTGTALTHSQSSSDRSVCANNLRRLTQAWQMYADDYSGALMANAIDDTHALRWVSGYMDYSSGAVNASHLTNSAYAAMGLYVKNPAYFRCPADHSTVLAPTPTLRVRSYSMNAYVGRGENNVLWSPGFVIMTNIAQVPQPDRTFVLIGEHPDSINDMVFQVDVADLGAATRIIDYPAAYHSGGANLSFGDGHVECWRWADARTMPAPGSTLPGSSPGNPDIARLQKVTSYRP